MEVRAVAKDTGISPRKVRPLADMVRGKKVDEALAILKFASSPTARVVAKVVKSASANAENNFQMSSDLQIVNITVDGARPRARGRIGSILKRSSHITVVVAEQEEEIGS